MNLTSTNEPAYILVVDDDPLVRRLFHDMLVNGGYRVSTATSGEEALAYLNLVTPDLIVLDLSLPGIDGHEVTRRIRADESKPFIPIIIVTAQTDLTISITSLDAGADDVMTKPVVFDELLARVRAMLRLQRAQRSLRNEQRKTELLLHLTRELGASIDLDVLLTRFLNHLADAVGAVRASIILTSDDESEQVACYSSSRYQATSILGDIVRRGVAGWVLNERKPLVIADTRDDSRWIGNPTVARTVRSVAAMPVMREGRILGAITLVHHTPGYFTEQHIELLNSVAAQSAVALESAQLFRITQRQKQLLARRADELRRINEINQHISELMYPEQLLRLAVYMIQRQFQYPQVSLLLREGDELVLQASAGRLDSETMQRLRFPVSLGLNGLAVRTQQVVRADDVQADEHFAALLPGDEHVRSELVVPILLRREIFGTLDLQSLEPAAFSANDEAVLTTIVGHLSVALGNALLLENEQRRIHQLGQVNQLSVAITAQLDISESLHIAADALAPIFGAAQAGLVVLGADQEQEMVQVAINGRRADLEAELHDLLAASASLLAQIQHCREVALVSDLQADPRLAAFRPFLSRQGIDTVVVVPLNLGSQTIGMLCIDATGREQSFGPAELELATTIAALIAKVIDNARLYRVIEDERSTLNAVLRGAADPIMLIGPADELLLANRAAEEQLSLSLETTRGQSLHSLRAAHHNQFLDGLLPLLASIAGNGAFQGPAELTLPHDTTYSVSVAPVRSADGQPLGRVAVLQDITAIKLLERQERERVRSVFRRYVSPVVAEQLLSAGEDLGQPTEREVAVLFADMRGFTAITERLDPKVLVERVLNRYFTAMTNVLYRHEGTIDKFMGDGIIGVFGSPIARPDDPQRALITAVDMQRTFAELNAQWCADLGLDIGMGIGISYGRAVVGNIGSQQRLDYTLIGDVVNTASRLSGVARAGQIIISYHLRDALPLTWQSPWKLKALGQVQLKGKQEPHLIYEVIF